MLWQEINAGLPGRVAELEPPGGCAWAGGWPWEPELGTESTRSEMGSGSLNGCLHFCLYRFREDHLLPLFFKWLLVNFKKAER